jgi:hypothetical protein
MNLMIFGENQIEKKLRKETKKSLVLYWNMKQLKRGTLHRSMQFECEKLVSLVQTGNLETKKYKDRSRKRKNPPCVTKKRISDT